MEKACLKKCFKTLILSFFCLLTLNSQVKAQSALGLTATPVRVGDDNSLSLEPGETKQIQVKVKNNSQADLALESRIVDFVIGDDGSAPIVVEDNDNDRWSLASWVTLVPAYNQLVAGGTAVVNALIEVPADAMPGGHYAMIYHTPALTIEPEESGAGVSQRVATLLYVLVKGPINEEAYISRLEFPGFLENGPVDFNLTINNQSDIHISPEPVFKIYNMFGQEVASFKSDKKNIFPLTERDFSAQWDRVWGFGRYIVKVEAAYGLQGQVAVAEAALWLVPVKIIIVSLIVILILVAVLVTLKRKNQPMLMESQQPDQAIKPEGENEQEQKED